MYFDSCGPFLLLNRSDFPVTIASMADKIPSGSASLEKRSIDEKIESSSQDSVDLLRGDEALRLVDAENVVKFSEEYNLRLRRKLVSMRKL